MFFLGGVLGRWDLTNLTHIHHVIRRRVADNLRIISILEVVVVEL
jgi:hypothetical protein